MVSYQLTFIIYMFMGQSRQTLICYIFSSLWRSEVIHWYVIIDICKRLWLDSMFDWTRVSIEVGERSCSLIRWLHPDLLFIRSWFTSYFCLKLNIYIYIYDYIVVGQMLHSYCFLNIDYYIKVPSHVIKRGYTGERSHRDQPSKAPKWEVLVMSPDFPIASYCIANIAIILSYHINL